MKFASVFVLALQFAYSASSSSDYTHLGCFTDSYSRAMSEQLSKRVSTVEECANLAKKKGYSTFGVQNGGECWSNYDAAAKYNSKGNSGACSGGKGGSWANDVYQFKADKLIDLGCWKDNLIVRAIPKLHWHKYNKDVSVRVCTDLARSKGSNVFGVQDSGYCLYGENGESRYKMYGNSSKCTAEGVGAGLVNSVYKLPAQNCYSCNGKDSCSKVTCSSEPFCYKMSADRVTGGTTSRVSLAGCISNCTSNSKTTMCSGEKNCFMSCCMSGYCNDPNAPDNLPKCYACQSSVSAAECAANQYLIPCGDTEGDKSVCYSGMRNGTHVKGCSSNSQIACQIAMAIECGGKDKSKCNSVCCEGRGCNESTSIHAVSVFLLFACVLFAKFVF